MDPEPFGPPPPSCLDLLIQHDTFVVPNAEAWRIGSVYRCHSTEHTLVEFQILYRKDESEAPSPWS